MTVLRTAGWLSAGICASQPVLGAPRVIEAEIAPAPSGGVVKSYTLRNDNGISAKVLSLGAILAELKIPDRDGKLANVVLAPDDPRQFVEGFRGSAAVIGRVANRTAGARFTLDGRDYVLEANDGPNNLHGGPRHFGTRNWTGRDIGGSEAAVELSLLSPDGDEGFPGNLRVAVTYTLTDANELRLDYRATTDKPTIINLTNHAYFNLSGGDDILDHVVQLHASRYTPVDAQKIPTGEIAPVAGTPFDFRKPTRIGSRIDRLKPQPGGFDHNYVIDGHDGGKLVPAARVSHPGTGRVIEIRTTEPGVQFFTANHLAHRGVCFETQHFPDSIHHENFPSIVLRPGEEFRSTTVLAFSTAPETDAGG